MPTLTLNADLPLPLDLARAWQALHDQQLLRASVSADESLSPGEVPHAYQVALTGFEGRIVLLDLEAPSRLRLSFDGQGRATGATRGQAQLRLERLGDQRTLLHVALVLQTERQPGGLKREGAEQLQRVLNRFVAAVEERWPNGPRVAPAPPKPWPQRLLDWYLGWFAGIFNGTMFPPPKPRAPRKSGPSSRR